MLASRPLGHKATPSQIRNTFCNCFWDRRSRGGSLSCQAQKKTSRAKKIQSVKASPQQKPQQLKAPVDAVRELLEWYFRDETPSDKVFLATWALRSVTGLVPLPVLLRSHRLRRVLGDEGGVDADTRVIQDAVRTSEVLIMDADGTHVGPKPNPDSENKSLMLVVACALLDNRGQVLLAKRPEGKTLAGFWEFPGGKISLRERPEHALSRELDEELGIKVQEEDLQPLTFASHRLNEGCLLMPLYVCTRWEGTVVGREGQEVEWVGASELARREMPPADIPLIAAVQQAMHCHAQSSLSLAT